MFEFVCIHSKTLNSVNGLWIASFSLSSNEIWCHTQYPDFLKYPCLVSKRKIECQKKSAFLTEGVLFPSPRNGLKQINRKKNLC